MIKKEESRYIKINDIHKGQNGTMVYLGKDTKKNILIAIKSIPKMNMDADAQKNFRRELQNLHNLKHPNIIQILDYLNNKKTNYIILEYCNGGNLRDYIRRYMNVNRQPLNEFFIQKLLLQIAPALEYMHSKNIIHRDIRLENILLNFNNYPNIPIDGRAPQPLKFSEKSLNKDFSVKITGLNFSKDLIQDNMGSTILGTPLYMSPDMVERADDKSTKKYNTTADLWSLGVITYELLTGSMPFNGNDVKDVFTQIEKGIYTLPKKLKASIEIISFINGLLQYYPEKRLNWEQIKEHPFLKKNVEDFNYINLELYSDGEKNQVEINSKDNNSDNLLWIFFKCKELENLKMDKINQKEMAKSPIMDKIDKNKVINEEVRKATEQEIIEKEKEKEEINKMKIKAEKDKKKAELEKQKRQKEQEKLIKEENELNNKRKKLIQENEQNKKGTQENEKKANELKELEKKIKLIEKDKDNMEIKLQNIEKKIAENEKLKRFTERKIKKMQEDINDKSNNEQYKNEIQKLNEEKNKKFKEMERLKKEEEIKQQKYIKEKEELEKKMNEISKDKIKLENEVNKNNEVKNKINEVDKQLQNLKDELKQKEQEFQKSKEASEEIKNQINQSNKEIEEKKKEIEEKKKKIEEQEKKEQEKQEKEEQKKEEEEKKEEEKKEKDILGSFIQMNVEDYDKEIQDEWETISEKDINFDEDIEIDTEPIFTDYEIVENYVDTETAKNETK